MSVTDEDSLPTTPPTDRLAWRDTHIYASYSRDTMLGGLWASEGITNANLYSMLEIICSFTDTFHLYDDHKQLVGKDGQQLRPGNYFVVTNGRFLHCFHHWPLLSVNRFRQCHR